MRLRLPVNPKGFAIFIIVASAIVLAFVLHDRAHEQADPDAFNEAKSNPGQSRANGRDELEFSDGSLVGANEAKDERLERLDDGRVVYLPAVQLSKKLTAGVDSVDSIKALEQIMSAYRYFYKANPVCGGNRNVVEQLMGKNKHRVVFLDPEQVRMVNGELVDEYGRPFFFHALSGTEMEIRSSGPDRVMWTDDDLSSDMHW